MSLRTNMNHLQAQHQHVTIQRDSLLRLLMQLVIEHGGDSRELVISHQEANKIDLKCYVIDTVPTADGRMAIRYRNTVLNPTVDDAPRPVEPEARSGLALVPALSETIEEEERLNSLTVKIPAPCVCTHSKIRHVGSIGRCGEGTCNCEGYDAAVPVE